MADEAVVHVIDDDPAVRDSLSFLLAAAGLAVRTFETAGAFIDALTTVAPGCIVTDVRMPGMSGIELMAALAKRGITLPVIVITGHGDVPLAVEAMKLGAFDFIEKPFDDDTIIASVQAALAKYATSGRDEGRKAEVVAKLATLSQRERQVLDGLVAGHPNKTIAYDLGISPRTVEVYRANVMNKMGASSLSDLVRMTIIAGPGSE
jgi:two-component system response regulator FixJ